MEYLLGVLLKLVIVARVFCLVTGALSIILIVILTVEWVKSGFKFDMDTERGKKDYLTLMRMFQLLKVFLPIFAITGLIILFLPR